MPVASYQIPGGARVLLFTCEHCGRPASFGKGCNIRAALKAKQPQLAGQWYCGQINGEPACVHARAAA